MSGVKHTPGPWVAKSGTTSYPECDDADSWVAVLSPAGKEVVTLYERYSLRPDDRGCWEADARLIAAAPDLLEALMTARETIRALHGPNQWDIYDRCSPEMKAINAAIARATGDRPEKGEQA